MDIIRSSWCVGSADPWHFADNVQHPGVDHGQHCIKWHQDWLLCNYLLSHTFL